ncbi:MAG: hypothetical protein COA52_07605 [Hyphomicrobiales bacterium]|nr:MAG: hypothetical protein COA52_07605 [Hyphomicrobiales bacterium]
MALARSRRRDRSADYWPGFVDAMASILLVIIFLLSLFMLAQFFLSQEISGRDAVLSRLNTQIAELTELLALESTGQDELKESISLLQSNLTDADDEKARLAELLDNQSGANTAADGAISELNDELDSERQLNARAQAQVDLLNQQLAALRRQISSLENALDVSEESSKESQTKITDLGSRLNVALAQRVQELSRYRSDFFGRLREILSNRSDVRVVGDRFVFQSEVLFGSGNDDLNPRGAEEMGKLAAAILELQGQIPDEINWVLRVDGHTDARPVSGSGRFANNWELSSSRAISVVQFLVSQGVPPNRLVAAGFGEFQPLDDGDSPEALARNRRIELKLTER